ncbi:AAA family ATPase [Cohnella fermenti]|uniref:Shikimate kinase n=1 Tax=Cohnella fermenti TaxID=2565925 RepID=A0A4S4BGH8_9BACL|nr:AAA family ATPase [Cohnella fermenti]THF72876.1 shikimate kinase [Cohnella fermenti]
MKLVILFGPQAVGKMTVGQSLAARTGFKLFHNHTSIEFVAPYFDYGTPAGNRLVQLIRQELFDEVSRSDLDGFIFTYVWAFDLQADWDYVKHISELFESRGATVCYVELEADYAERLRRNTTENRLLHKPTKRDTVRSERNLIATHESHRLNSAPGELTMANYLRIDNTDLGSDEAARAIVEHFSL